MKGNAMIEISQDRRTFDAYRAAHEARGEALSAMLRRIFSSSRQA